MIGDWVSSCDFLKKKKNENCSTVNLCGFHLFFSLHWPFAGITCGNQIHTSAIFNSAMKGFTDTCLCQRKPKNAGQQNCQKKLFLVRPQLFSSSYQVSWFTSLCRGILDNDRPTLDLDQVHEDQPLLRGFLLHLKQSVLL